MRFINKNILFHHQHTFEYFFGRHRISVTAALCNYQHGGHCLWYEIVFLVKQKVKAIKFK